MSNYPCCDTAAADGLVRALHPLVLPTGPTGAADIPGEFGGLAIDVETTGLNAESDKVIELAMRTFRYNREGIITHIYEPHCWREDPDEPLSPAITQITGLTDEDVRGCRIDEVKATELMKKVSFVVAHNSAFDRKFVEARLPEVAGLAWCCSLNQVDWRARGMGHASLGFLLHECGYYHTGHRADSDVDALIQVLRHRDANGTTALTELIQRGSALGWSVKAVGAAYDTKGTLKERGYRWDARNRCWSIELENDDALTAERAWLAEIVYSAGKGARAHEPTISPITAHTRFL